MPNDDGTPTHLELLEDIDDVLKQLIGEGSTPELVRRALTLRQQLPDIMDWAQTLREKTTRMIQEIERRNQQWAGKEQEREAAKERHRKAMAPTGAPMYVMCWTNAHNHWRSLWLVGPFDGLEAANQWGQDYIEDGTFFAVEWSGDLADIRVLSPNPAAWSP